MIWRGQRTLPRTPLEMITFGETLAERGDEEAMRYIDALRPEFPIEADALLARLRWRQNRLQEGAAALIRVFDAYRRNPWPLPVVMRRTLGLVVEMAGHERFGEFGQAIYAALHEPFSIEMFNEQRKSALLFIAQRNSNGRCSADVLEVIRSYEPYVPWQRIFLEKRATCYAEAGDPRAARAAGDLRELERYERKSLDSEPPTQ